MATFMRRPSTPSVAPGPAAFGGAKVHVVVDGPLAGAASPAGAGGDIAVLPVSAHAAKSSMSPESTMSPGSSRRGSADPSFKPRVAILGTGRMGVALATRLHQAGYEVVFGSRSGRQQNLNFTCSDDAVLAKLNSAATRLPLEAAAQAGDVVLLAVPFAAMRETLARCGGALAGRVVVDCCNAAELHGRRRPPGAPSCAEQVAAMLPKDAYLAKAFNTLSAYEIEALETLGTQAPEVAIAGDHGHAEQAVSEMAKAMGYSPVHFGSLRAAPRQEALPFAFFSKWGRALLFTGIAALWPILYSIVRYHHYDRIPAHHAPLFIGNKAVAWIACQNLALVYLPGLVAWAMRPPLPSPLVAWLEIRKQIGLLGLALAGLHAVLSLALISPAVYSKFFEVDVSAVLPKFNIDGEASVLLGACALLLFVLVGVTSLPSVARTMSWKEWHFVQSWLGYFCVFLTCGHVLATGARSWPKTSTWPGGLPPISIMSTVPLMALLVMKALWSIPFVERAMIRRKWQVKPGPVTPVWK
eukprot:tig00000241_g21023.t1